MKWFADKGGMIRGLAVAGCGAGALVTAPVAQRLIPSAGLPTTFAILGAAYLVLVTGAALFMKNPPDGYRPAGWQPPAQQTARAARDFTLGEALRTWQWYALWAILFLNTSAGVSITSHASPIDPEVTHAHQAAAAGLDERIPDHHHSRRLL